jgi:CHAT domain-containing protein
VTSEDVKSFELPSQESIEELAGTAAKLLSVSDQQQYRADLDWALSELSEILLRPVEDQLAGKSRILIVAEGALQYVPFAVLPSPTAAKSDSAPLISSHEIINLPSASVLHALREQFDRRPAPIRDVAVFADPVFDLDDGRSETYQPATRSEGEGPDQIPERLYFTGLEAEAIMQLAAGGENLQALRFDATKEALINPELSDYRYVHIATHGHLDSELPELSSLLFSRYDPEGRELDGRVRLHEIYQLELRAELVVLSACRTAHGRDVRGEGIVGWTQGFMYSGAKRVLVSLWNVEDEATAELMRHFYRFLLVERLSPAASLRRAQDAIRQMPQWRMPYHWAGFVLSGEFL